MCLIHFCLGVLRVIFSLKKTEVKFYRHSPSFTVNTPNSGWHNTSCLFISLWQFVRFEQHPGTRSRWPRASSKTQTRAQLAGSSIQSTLKCFDNYRISDSSAFHQRRAPAFYPHGSAYLCHVVFGPILPSESCGWLDFGGEDLPEPPLQLLHVRRLGSGQVEASSSLLAVPSSQRPDHLLTEM